MRLQLLMLLTILFGEKSYIRLESSRIASYNKTESIIRRE